MKFRYAILVIVTLTSLLTGSLDALAQISQEPTGFNNVQLWVYPEYDDPRLLVMLEGKITGAAAPVKVRFLVPTAAEMYSAGSMDAQGKYSGGPPNRQASQIAGWDEISYELKTETFRVEYYDPIIPTQPDKKVSYDFRWLYPISDLKVIIQQPKNSTGFTVAPTGGKPTTADGLPALLYEYSSLDQNPLHFDIAYTRTDAKPSTTGLGSTGNATGSDTWLAVTTLVIVGALLAIGVLWIIRSMQKQRPHRATARAGRPAASAPARRPPSGRFCTQCGRAIDSQARFCPQCGAKLR